jgi:hypothetical protein
LKRLRSSSRHGIHAARSSFQQRHDRPPLAPVVRLRLVVARGMRAAGCDRTVAGGRIAAARR